MRVCEKSVGVCGVSVGFLWVVFGCGGAVMVAIRAANAEDDVHSPLNRSGSCPNNLEA